MARVFTEKEREKKTVMMWKSKGKQKHVQSCCKADKHPSESVLSQR